MRVYIAGRFGRREEFRKYGKELEAAGHASVSSWLYSDEPDEDAGNMPASERSDFAVKNMQDVAKCHVLFAFTEEEGAKGASRGGRHVEFGAALAMNKEVFVIGPRENLFHYLPGLPQCETFDEALEALERF